MLKIEDFKKYKDERELCWKRFSKDESDFEIIMSFCFDVSKDNAWYQIVIGQCFDNDYKEIEEHHFNSLKKAVKWWNEYFEGDTDNDIHFAI